MNAPSNTHNSEEIYYPKEGAKAFRKTNPLNQRKALKLFAGKWRPIESTAIKCFEYRLERCFEVNALAPHLRSKASTTNR